MLVGAADPAAPRHDPHVVPSRRNRRDALGGRLRAAAFGHRVLQAELLHRCEPAAPVGHQGRARPRRVGQGAVGQRLPPRGGHVPVHPRALAPSRRRARARADPAVRGREHGEGVRVRHRCAATRRRPRRADGRRDRAAARPAPRRRQRGVEELGARARQSRLTASLPVPAAVDIEDLSAAWLADALDLDVRSLTHERIGAGQTGASYRLTLDADGLPPTLVAKLATGASEARHLVSAGYRNEVGFYADLVDTLDVLAPRCWYAAISDDGLRFTLLLEDLAPLVPGVQTDGCTIPNAAAAVRNLAGLHAPRWNDASLRDLDF